MSEAIAKVHSYETFGAVDGPGIRFIVFLQGCCLRCLFCHNPDTWECGVGKEITASRLIKKIIDYKNYIARGGVTISGGEPLLQAQFCEELIDECHKENISVAIDTSGSVPLEKSRKAILKADYILLDLKDIDSEDCKILTGMGNENAIATLRFCEENNKTVWIRHVLLPQYTLNYDKLRRLGEFLSAFSCIQNLEILPYHTMGLFKWENLGIESKIKSINPPSFEEIKMAEKILADCGLKIV